MKKLLSLLTILFVVTLAWSQSITTTSLAGSSGALPAGAGTEVQYRLNASAFGAVANSSYNAGTSILALDTTTLVVDGVNHRVGIGTTTPSSLLEVNNSGAGDGHGTTNRVAEFTNGYLYVSNSASGVARPLITLDSFGVGWTQFYNDATGITNLALGATSSPGTPPTTPTMYWNLDTKSVGIGTATPNTALTVVGGVDTAVGNGQSYVHATCLTELLSVASGITTKASTIQFPADATALAVPVRVLVQPGGTTTMTVTSTTSATAFQKGANISTVATTTDPGTKNTPANYSGVAAQTITLTFNASTTNALGSIRVGVCYSASTPPTS